MTISNVSSVFTVGELITTPKANLPNTVQVLGYYEAGDGGGGLYQYQTSSATVNDGTVLSVLNEGDKRWLRVAETASNVKWFGAKGDNINDDTEAIRHAITWAQSTNAVVELPAGTYKLTGPLIVSTTAGLVIRGAFGQTDIVQHAADQDVFRIDAGTNVESSNVIIRDLTIKASVANSTAAIWGRLISRCQFVNVIITPPEDGSSAPLFNEGVHIEGMDDVNIENCRIRAATICVHAWGVPDSSSGPSKPKAGGGTILTVANGGVGVQVSGSLGGVYIDECDILSSNSANPYGKGLVVSRAATPQEPNREIFISATVSFDSLAVGIEVADTSLTHFMATGAWFGTCSTAIQWNDGNGAIFEASACRIANVPLGGYGFRFPGANSNLLLSGCRFSGKKDNAVPPVYSQCAIDITGSSATYTITGNVIQTFQTCMNFGPSDQKFLVEGNFMTGYVLSMVESNMPDGTFKVIKDNPGFQTHAAGTTVIPAGQSQVLVAHGLANRPSVMLATPNGDSAMALHVDDNNDNVHLRIRFLGGGTFPANIAVSWYAQLYKGM